MRRFLLFVLFTSSLLASEHFDLRDQGYASSPKVHHGNHSWVYSVISSLESNILIESSWTLGSGVVDLSETDLIEKKYLAGNYKFAAAYLSLYGGAAYEKKSSSNDQSLRFIPSSIEWLTHSEHQINIERIQESILVNGSVGSLAHNSNNIWEVDLNGEIIDFNFKGLKNDHFVNIIGWDNNRSIPPFLPGVWLVQDSRLRNKSPYYFTPYGNLTVGQEKESGAVSFNKVSAEEFKNIYSYAKNGHQYEFSAEKVSNLYSLDKELPYKVGIYTVIPDDSAVVIISDTEGNIICHSKNRAFSNPGFYLLELACGNKTKVSGAIRVEFITESGLYAHDGNKVYTVKGKPTLLKTKSLLKQSFYYKNGKWIDLKTLYVKEVEQMGIKHNFSGTSNFAINLYTK